jgi:DNA primase
MIPIHDLRGRVVGFGGRALDPEAKPKYLNSPETALFRKSELLFNAHRAREAAHKESRLVLVEGYMDAIALWQAGFKPVVAALGTAFNEAHVQNLWKLAPEPVICFDGDRAGLGAAHRAVDRVIPELKEGRSFWFAFLPDGEDPDDFVRRRGLEAFNALVAGARPLSDVLWDREVGRWPVNTPERMAGFEGRIREAVQAVKDRGVQRRYELHFRVRLASFFYRLEREKVGRRAAAPPGAA